MSKKFIITILLISAILSVGCGGAKPFKPNKLDNDDKANTNNILNNTNDIEYVNIDNVQSINNQNIDNNVGIDSVQSVNNANVVNVQRVDNVQVQNNRPSEKVHQPIYKDYTVRVVDARSGPRDQSVRVDTSSWKINEFTKNNKDLSEMFLRRVRSGSQKIRGDNGRIRFFFDSNGDIYGISRYGQKFVYKKYIGAVLVKHTDPDYRGIHGKYVVGMLYRIMVKDRRVTEQFEKYKLPEVGEYEVLILDQDKTNVPNTKTIYMDSYKLDTKYDLNPENFYTDYPMRGGNHKRTRLIPQNWREYVFSN